MRRQPKPFVTEYRGSARRGKDGGAPEAQHEPARSRAFEDAQRLFQSDATEDSYEAALRAADALFARPPQPSSPPRGAPSISTDMAGRDRTFDDVPRSPTQDESVDAEVDRGKAGEIRRTEAASAVFSPAEKGSGPVAPRRILQAIEPDADDRFAALEAERAPKRRGRKPGSKNKPKVAAGDDWSAIAESVGPASATTVRMRSARTPIAAGGLDDPMLSPEAAPADPIDRAGLEIEPVLDPGQPRGRTDKFGRRREGLRPGERWKRRLPKVAW